MKNTTWTGENLCLRLYGASHEEYVGCVLSNFPPGIEVDKAYIDSYVQRRMPGRLYGSGRKEADEYVFASGVKNGQTTGEDIDIRIANKDVRSSDYRDIAHCPRPSHADYVSYIKYKTIAAGGGIFSGRMTAPLVAAGALCDIYCRQQGVLTAAHLAQIGTICDAQPKNAAITQETINQLNEMQIPLFDSKKEAAIAALVEELKKEKDAIGGRVQIFAIGLPAGIGEGLFGNLEAKISALCYSVPGVKAVSFGLGEAFQSARASEVNDEYYYDENQCVKTYTNHNGGILGGIATGMPLVVSCVFKPTPSIAKVQRTVDLKTKKNTTIEISGRHDVCIALRGLWAVRACLCIAMADALLAAQNTEISLKSLRSEIDKTDGAMARLFNYRMNLSAKIGKIKRAEKLEILDGTREQKVLQNVAEHLEEQNKRYAKEYIEKIMELSKRKQEEEQ